MSNDNRGLETSNEETRKSHAKVEKHLSMAAEVNKTNSKNNNFPEAGK